VLSVPYELRLLLAKSPEALNAVARLFVEQIARFQRERARAAGIESPKTGAIVFPQRFGGSLNLNVHFHVAVPDGVYTVARESGNELATANFHPLAQPTQRDLDEITHNVDARVCAWLRRKAFLRNQNENESNDAEARPSALDACLVASLGVGELSSVRSVDRQSPEDRPARPAKADRRPGSSNGFNLHAGVVVASDDRAGRERLLRYCARPPLSLERLSLLPGGRIAYAVRNASHSKRSHRVMTPLQFLARLCALIPPPRHPLIRFHGVFAPHSRARAAVIPKRAVHAEGNEAPSTVPAEGVRSRSRISGDGTSALNVAPKPETPLGRRGLPRIDWAELLKRVYDADALACPCGGRLRMIALITEPDTAKQILVSLGMPADAPPVARARSPDFDLTG
jgi:hypothetical protein